MATAGMVRTITINGEAEAELVERLCAAGWQIIVDNQAQGSWGRRVTLVPKASANKGSDLSPDPKAR